MNSNNFMNAAAKKAFEERVKIAFDNKILVEANDPFLRIKDELIQLGWGYIDALHNLVETDEHVFVTVSPAIHLTTEIYNIKMIPYEDGIEISRLEVRLRYQGNGFGSLILDNLLTFLTSKGVEEIYVAPIPAGIPMSSNCLAFNAQSLEQFFRKRGFRPLPKGEYWKLEFKDYLKKGTYYEKVISKDFGGDL